jgi:hypothetical protein
MANPKIDLMGFDKEVETAKKAVYVYGFAYAFYKEGEGFIFRSKMDSKIEEMLYDGEVSLVGVYERPFRTKYLVEDLKFEIDSRFNPQQKESEPCCL